MAKKNEKCSPAGSAYTDVFRQNAMQFEELSKLKTRAEQTARDCSKEIGDANSVSGSDSLPETGNKR